MQSKQNKKRIKGELGTRVDTLETKNKKNPKTQQLIFS